MSEGPAVPSGTRRCTASALWGGINVVVPPSVRVELEGVGILGGFNHEQDPTTEARTGRPVLRIRGFAISAASPSWVASTSRNACPVKLQGGARKRLSAARKALRSAPRG